MQTRTSRRLSALRQSAVDTQSDMTRLSTPSTSFTPVTSPRSLLDLWSLGVVVVSFTIKEDSA
jgi:hypothetical protein